MTEIIIPEPTESTATTLVVRTKDELAVQVAKQIALAVVSLTIAWAFASALTPDPTLKGEGVRSLLTMPFLAACGAVVALFATNACAFTESQLTRVGNAALLIGILAGALWFLAGVLTANRFDLGAVLHFAFASFIVTVLVAAVGLLAQLLVRKLS